MPHTNQYTPKQIIDFWFNKQISPYWFNATPKIDQDIYHRYQGLWQQADADKLDHWMNCAMGALALIIILDQFPLNMFRGDKKAFISEQKAVQITLRALDKKYDKNLNEQQLIFLYMPLMHSEDIAMQDLILDIATKTKIKNLDFIQHHHSIVKRFGRFPHRNQILGRKSTATEIKYLNSPQAFVG